MIAVFFGGRSCEHDISIITGLQAMSAASRKTIGVYIAADGVWWSGDGFDSVSAVKNMRFHPKRVHIRPGEPYLYCKNRRLCKIDAALLCMHGMLGEDGALQGLLEMCGIPYTGSGVLASAIGMNKAESKRVFEHAGLDVLPYAVVRREEYEQDAQVSTKSIIEEIKLPVIVKPCNLGSSIGISVAKTRTELYAALRVAFEWDDVAIVEKALTDFIEVNCAVLDTGEKLIVSDTEQPVGWKEFLTFSDKYSADVKSARHKIPAEIDEKLNEQVQNLAVRTFEAVGCSGVARVDFLVKDFAVYINEINTIPGSLSCALFRRGGIGLSLLIDMLIDAALKRHTAFERLKRVYTPTEALTAK